ncbi:MAG: TetR family transcriptional regulator [Fibrobacteres bacterium]|nr:TetR family transcriptional regulator [Fibrobacterota bacterium]
MVQADKRERLIQAADGLFHQKGFEHTSIADVASAAEVPLGNVYYYFKTRGDLMRTVSEHRLASARARREGLNALPSPRDRLIAWVNSFEDSTEECTAYGCPIGSLCLEANKLGGPMAKDASVVFRDSLEWMRKQFLEMGFADRMAREYAARILGGRQGSILLANTFKEPEYIRLEIARLRKWLGELPAGKGRNGK